MVNPLKYLFRLFYTSDYLWNSLFVFRISARREVYFTRRHGNHWSYTKSSKSTNWTWISISSVVLVSFLNQVSTRYWSFVDFFFFGDGMWCMQPVESQAWAHWLPRGLTEPVPPTVGETSLVSHFAQRRPYDLPPCWDFVLVS